MPYLRSITETPYQTESLRSPPKLTIMPQKGKANHKTVRISRSMVDAIDEFLQTDSAKKMAFNSKADVVTAAVRELLIRYGCYPNVKKERN